MYVLFIYSKVKVLRNYLNRILRIEKMWSSCTLESLIGLLMLVALELVQHCSSQQSLIDLPGYFDGPQECLAILEGNSDVFSEYPDGTKTEQNFLNMLEPCNHEAEVAFIYELKSVYTAERENGTNLVIIMEKISEIWERWRSNTISGSIEGNRICNPRRLLSCHQSLSQCVCSKLSFDFH